MDEKELTVILNNLRSLPEETEVVEFKEAKENKNKQLACRASTQGPNQK
jgi:hypothetical protein